MVLNIWWGSTTAFFFLSIRLPPGLLLVLGLLTRYMTHTLGAALLYVVHHDGVTTTSSRAGAYL